MVRVFFIILFTLQFINAKDIYQENCVACHKVVLVDLKDMYFKYLKRYSSEKAIKSVMMYYLQNPDEDITVMPKEYIRLFGIKNRTSLNVEDLKKAIELYYSQYKLQGKIK